MPELNLDAITLGSGQHTSPESGMCVMEAVAYIAGEPFSDHPECACPVISAFLRSYNDSVSEDARQILKLFIPRMVGTKSTPEVEDRRALVATDWMVRTYTPAWLRVAGLAAQASMLSSLPEITSMAQVPSIMGPINAVRVDARAARAAARDAAWAAAWDAAWAAAWDAAWAAAGAAARAAAGAAAWAAAGAAAWAAARDAAGAAAWAAARAAAWDAAWDAVRAALAPTIVELQSTVPDLIERMLAVK